MLTTIGRIPFLKRRKDLRGSSTSFLLCRLLFLLLYSKQSPSHHLIWLTDYFPFPFKISSSHKRQIPNYGTYLVGTCKVGNFVAYLACTYIEILPAFVRQSKKQHGRLAIVVKRNNLVFKIDPHYTLFHWPDEKQMMDTFDYVPTQTKEIRRIKSCTYVT